MKMLALVILLLSLSGCATQEGRDDYDDAVARFNSKADWCEAVGGELVVHRGAGHNMSKMVMRQAYCQAT